MRKYKGVIKGAEDRNTVTEEKQAHLVDQLKKIQRQKNCLIVVDGILEISQWKEISCAFVLKDTKTRILVTTRDDKTIPHEEVHLYGLKCLSDDDGWELLKKFTFRGKKAPEYGIAPTLGKEMVRKCGNIPLAISSLGRILSELSLNEWHKVHADVHGYLQRDNQSRNQSDERSNPNFCLNNDPIPYDLNQCFLYLGIFKEDVDSEDLTLLWMAEGMVSSIETSQSRLRELGNMGMLQVQVDELSANTKFMPLTLRNHARPVSLDQGEQESSPLKVVDFSDGKQPRFALFYRTRRLAIHFNKLSSPLEYDIPKKIELRSLFFLNSDRECVNLPVIPHFNKYALVRVLHFVRCKFEDGKLLEGLENLFNLRYLGIIYCHLDQLPKSICNIRNLCVLNVRAYEEAKIKIPNELSKLSTLKHLRLSNHSGESQKLKLDGLHHLETFVGFNNDTDDLDSLYKLKKLRLLVAHAYNIDCLISIMNFVKHPDSAHVRTNLFIEYKCDFIEAEGLGVLEEVLMCPNLNALTFSMVLIHKFPNCGIKASSDLTEIKLIGCKLSEDPMEALGKFQNLRKLCLGYGAFIGEKISHHDRSFQNLEYLEFRYLPNLEKWDVGEGALLKLSDLTVRRCPKLKEIPEGLASVSSLRNMEIELAASALPNGKKEEYDKMFEFVT